MVIRCKQCHGSVQIQNGTDLGVTCPTCNQRYVLDRSLGQVAREKLFAAARETARVHEIDLPGAYSIVLGIMPVEEVRALHRQPATIVTPDVDEEHLSYDPDFKESVEAGFLTSSQALERGQREVLARQLANRHRLSIKSALAVTDNRTSLLTAIRARKTPRTTPVQIVRSPRSRAWLCGMSVVVLTAVAGMLFSGFSTVKNVHAALQEDRVKIRTDDRGRVLQIEGPDAVSVLDAYCGSGERVDRYECVGVRRSPRDGDRVRLGVFRKRVEPELEFAIYISRNRGGRRWLAGNGRSPLAGFLAPNEHSGVADVVSAEQ